ncbi:hypothetical protein OPV22_034288 [Ensete ventricosum]|uniref:Uncharacterized protein n=1 Tax=Ensete ventricosum TaxID=4639 RepID=A0AAV8Q0L7_ENSVE|nr:hypothetical protein OPV22_034288 [Ensete ventricosum]
MISSRSKGRASCQRNPRSKQKSQLPKKPSMELLLPLNIICPHCVVGPSRLPLYVNNDKEEDGNGTTSNSFTSAPYYFLSSLGFSVSALPDRKAQAIPPALTSPLLRRFFVTNLSTPFECSVGGRSPSQPPHPAVPLRSLGKDLVFPLADAAVGAPKDHSFPRRARESTTGAPLASLNKTTLFSARRSRFLGFGVDSEESLVGLPRMESDRMCL